MRTNTAAARAPLIDLLKVVSIQLIVWHHLVFYGPMSDVVYPWAPSLFDWLYDRGRLAVQVFLVVGGYLAAQSLQRRLQPAAGPLPLGAAVAQVWRRYLRLGRPYWVALGLAVLSAALARTLMDHPATPAAPTWAQVAAHLLMLHDVLGDENLSAGVWYVAIDLQLYALLTALAWAAGWLARGTGAHVRPLWLAGCAALTALSLVHFNLDPQLDRWGVYFFGAYGLGVLAHAIGRRERPAAGIVAFGLLLAGALAIAWRDRVIVAGLTALVLLRWGGVTRLGLLPRRWQRALLPHLADRSYALFLVHYPVCLAVNAVVRWGWPGEPLFNAIGMLAAWAASLMSAEALYRVCESPEAIVPWARLRQGWQAVLLSLAIARISAAPAASAVARFRPAGAPSGAMAPPHRA